MARHLGEQCAHWDPLCLCSRPGRLTSWARAAVNKTHAGWRHPRVPSQHKVKHSWPLRSHAPPQRSACVTTLDVSNCLLTQRTFFFFPKSFNYARRSSNMLQDRIVSAIICKSALITKFFSQRRKITFLWASLTTLISSWTHGFMVFIDLQTLLTL